MKKQKDREPDGMLKCYRNPYYKLPLMFIGKALNPCCFKNINKKALIACSLLFAEKRMGGLRHFSQLASQPVCSSLFLQ